MRAKKPRGRKWRGMQRQFAKAIIRNNYFMELTWHKMGKRVTIINLSYKPFEDCKVTLK